MRGNYPASSKITAGIQKILALGDSNTLCSFLTNPAGGYRYYLKDFVRARNIWWVGTKGVSGESDWLPCEAVGGYTCSLIAGLATPAITAFSPHICILLGGQNDLSGSTVDQAEAAHASLVDGIFTQSPNIKLIVCTIHRTTQANDADVVLLNARIRNTVVTRKAAGKNIYLCDLRAATDAIPDAQYLAASPDGYLAADGSHLLWNGHILWASILQPILDVI